MSARLPDPLVPGGATLDTHTQRNDNSHRRKRGFAASILRGRARRLWSRIHLGLMLPGRYYFVTLTSSPKSPSLDVSYNNLRRWLHRHYPYAEWLYCFTNEGHGVIHAVVRIPGDKKNIDVKKLRRYWDSLHNAFVIHIDRVKYPKNLEEYLAYQQRKKKLAKEFLYQPDIQRWKFTRGWLPVGFTRAFGRYWHVVKECHIEEGQALKMLSEWLQVCHERPDQVKEIPIKIIRKGVKHDL